MKLLLDGSYTAALTDLAIEEGLVSGKDREIDDRYYQHNKRYRRRVLEVALLSESVDLTMADPGVDYENLTSVDGLTIRSHAPSEELLWDKHEKLLSDPMVVNDIRIWKPLIVEHLNRGFTTFGKESFSGNGVTSRQFVSKLVDHFTGAPIDEDFMAKCATSLWEMQPLGSRAFSSMDLYWHYVKNSAFPISYYIRELLKLSTSQGYVLASSALNKRALSAIVRREPTVVNASTPHVESYRVLMLSMHEILGDFPRLDSLREVLHLKASKPKQIAALRNAIQELVGALANNKHAGTQKAVELVRKAQADLNRYSQLTKLSNWTTYVSLPVSVLETATSVFPVLGLAMGSLGVGSTYLTQKLEQNNWLALYRG